MELKHKWVTRFLLTMLMAGGIILFNVMASPVTSVQATETDAGEAFEATTSIAVGADHSLVICSNGTLWAWGSNWAGQLGLGDTTDRLSPTQVGNVTDWVAVSAGFDHSLGLRSDGTLWVWGRNYYGQLGLGDTTNRLSPTQVGSTTNWVAVSAGLDHSLGLRSDGTLWVWGRNDYGQLGLGDTTNRLSPTQVGSATNWVAVSTGRYHSLGLCSDGTLWAWGWNYYGQLGLGHTTDRLSPTQVGSATSWVAVSAGDWHSLGLRSDGTLWAWGYNDWSQLGLGDIPPTDRLSPTRVGSGTSWVAVSAGYLHSLGLRSDGTLWAWGANEQGQLGLGDTTIRNTPTHVGSATSWAAVCAGCCHSLGVCSDGTLWAWGWNYYGQLGLGDNTDRWSPTQVNLTLACVEIETATGTGTAYFTPSNGIIEDLEALPAPSPLPHGVRLPHGMFTFRITGLSANQSVTLTVEFPEPIPTHWVWWKYHDDTWSRLPIGRITDPRIITVTLIDGGAGDFDDIPGQINDPGGPGNPGAVGWETYPINKARVLLSWIVMPAVFIAVASLLMLKRRGRGREHT